jgi:hypothetical protein
LRQTAAGRAAEDLDPNQPNLSPQFFARSDRASVTGAFKKNWHRFERRFDPPFFRSHESLASIKSYAIWVNLFFDEADVATAFEASESNLGKVVDVYAMMRVFFQIMR